MSRDAKKVIKNYLDEMAKKDELFAKAYANEGKSLDSCFNYILDEARKRGTTVCMTDDEVFCLAIHYYVEGDLKDVKRPSDYMGHSVEKCEKTIDSGKASKKKADKKDTVGMGYLFDF